MRIYNISIIIDDQEEAEIKKLLRDYNNLKGTKRSLEEFVEQIATKYHKGLRSCNIKEIKLELEELKIEKAKI